MNKQYIAIIAFIIFIIFILFYTNANQNYESFQLMGERNRIQKNFYNAKPPNPDLMSNNKQYNPFTEQENEYALESSHNKAEDFDFETNIQQKDINDGGCQINDDVQPQTHHNDVDVLQEARNGNYGPRSFKNNIENYINFGARGKINPDLTGPNYINNHIPTNPDNDYNPYPESESSDQIPWAPKPYPQPNHNHNQQNKQNHIEGFQDIGARGTLLNPFDQPTPGITSPDNHEPNLDGQKNTNDNKTTTRVIGICKTQTNPHNPPPPPPQPSIFPVPTPPPPPPAPHTEKKKIVCCDTDPKCDAPPPPSPSTIIYKPTPLPTPAPPPVIRPEDCCPPSQVCPPCPKCVCPPQKPCPPVCPDKCPDISDYVKKSSIPPCPQLPDMSAYILKTEIPSCPKCPDMSKFVLKSSIPPPPKCQECPPCHCPAPPDIKVIEKQIKPPDININAEYENQNYNSRRGGGSLGGGGAGAGTGNRRNNQPQRRPNAPYPIRSNPQNNYPPRSSIQNNSPYLSEESSNIDSEYPLNYRRRNPINGYSNNDLINNARFNLNTNQEMETLEEEFLQNRKRNTSINSKRIDYNSNLQNGIYNLKTQYDSCCTPNTIPAPWSNS